GQGRTIGHRRQARTPWLRPSSRSAAMWATRAQRSTPRLPACATAPWFASSPARPITARPPGASKTRPRSSPCASSSPPPLRPPPLLSPARDIGAPPGRDPPRARRWGPRRGDIDILAYDDVKVDETDLILPHPRLFERAFVLVPLDEIAADRLIAGRRVHDA